MKRDSFALYVHVPFCAQKCPYCDFNTYATPKAPESEYVTALKKELRHYASDARFSGRKISTIFWGGGTPSLLSPSAIYEVHAEARSLFGVNADAEVTLEANPSSPSKEQYQGYRAAGVNRVSFGVQSFHPQQLALLGRDHSPEDAETAVRLCVEAGIPNVSVDLIFGVADQTLCDLEYDLTTAAALPISHLSTYALTIEPGTPFFQRQERGLLPMPTDELVASMLEHIPLFLTAHGFSRYEISNYARNDQRSRHNEAYWLGHDYLGIGAGAHSYVATFEGERSVAGLRWSTLALPASYMKVAGTPATVSWREALSQSSLEFEYFYVGLRRMAGVSLDRFERLFGVSASSRYGEVLQDLAAEGFIHMVGDIVTLTTSGIALSDSVYERLAGS
jgi:oxygen-independent coproporphyrinogen-3 oxidase